MAAVFILAALGTLDLLGRIRHRPSHYLIAFFFGSVLSIGLLTCGKAMLELDTQGNAYALSLGLLFIVLLWRMIFGDWKAESKATVLGTLVFWLGVSMLSRASGEARLAQLIAIIIAVIPAAMWCLLFLSYHRERISVVLLLFFSGILSTVPILFYDALVRSGAKLPFFFFTITPQSFQQSTQSFVSTYWADLSPMQSSITVIALSFLLVGLIEEGSKFWMLRKSGQRFFASIDDAMQLAILVGIGFAFAENIVNTAYFTSFVREHLLTPGKRDWMAFLGNITGRSVLTSMVHIVSTGLIGYFLGLAVFAGPLLQEQRASGKQHRFLAYFHRLLGLPERFLFRQKMLLTGYVLGSSLHALSNFLVTLPDVLPGNPRTLGDLLQSGPSSPLHFVAILLVPMLFYVVGGYWLLTYLFGQKENMQERGYLLPVETFVTAEDMQESMENAAIREFPSNPVRA